MEVLRIHAHILALIQYVQYGMFSKQREGEFP
jgi:hypothetical protein